MFEWLMYNRVSLFWILWSPKLIPLFCTFTNESGLDHMAGKSALMIVLLLHRIGLQTLCSLSVDNCLYTVWNYILQLLVYCMPPKIFFLMVQSSVFWTYCNQIYSGLCLIKYILDLVRSNIFWTLCNQIYSGFSAIKCILECVKSNIFWI